MTQQFLQGEDVPAIPQELDSRGTSKAVGMNLCYSGRFTKPRQKVSELALREWTATEGQE